MTGGRGCRVGLLLVLAIVTVDITPSSSQRAADFVGQVLCIHDLLKSRLLATVPVGCEIVDCCPQCPAHDPVDWRIHLNAPPGVSVRLELENLSEAARGRLRLAGTVRWVGPRVLEITPGVAFVRRFPRAFSGRPPVAQASLMVRATAAGETAGYRRRIEIALQQLVGAVVVKELRQRLDLVNCRPRPPGPDVVSLKSNVSQDNAVILLDAQRTPAACGNDEIWRGAGDVTVGNVLAPQACNTEVIVFSQHSAMQWLDNVTAWTDFPGDRVDVILAAPWQLPVTLWVVQGPFAASGGTGTGDDAAENVARATDLYSSMNCGLTIQATIVDATAHAGAAAALRRCSDGPGLRALVGFTPGRVNVYYLADVLKEGATTRVRGAYCGLVLASPTPEDRNTALVNVSAMDAESLAHELGHALSLRDRNQTVTPGAPSYLPLTNVMAGGGESRDSLTEGQCFRMNAGPMSALNRNGVRTGPTRDCDDPIASATCPALSLDADPNN